MTELAIPQAATVNHLSETPFARLLAQGARPPELVAYRGVLTPLELCAPERETTALVSGVAVHDLGWFRRVAVRGEDRFRWLSGMVTNSVNDLAANACAWNLVLNAQGRILGDLHVCREGENLSLVIAADQYEKLMAHLERFIIMDDVELVPISLDSDGETALGIAGPQAADILTRLGLPAPVEAQTSARGEWHNSEIRVNRSYGVATSSYDLWANESMIPSLWTDLIDAGATPVGATSLEALRIAEGIPAYGIDLSEKELAQESSQLRAISFNKGCYLGQEIVERIRSRGSVHRRLRTLEIFGPLPAAGAELTLEGGIIAGQITSAAELPLARGSRSFALGMMRSEAEAKNQSFSYAAGGVEGRARILSAPPEL
jgi:folate-binding protein YgfZ